VVSVSGIDDCRLPIEKAFRQIVSHPNRLNSGSEAKEAPLPPLTLANHYKKVKIIDLLQGIVLQKVA
jgi:hypothetical protein